MFATATSIAIWFPSLEHMGGIERVILEHIRIFSERGHKLVLVLEEMPTRFKSLITCPCVVMLKTQERKLQWAQVHGRNNLTFRQRVAHDLRYARKLSPWLDLQILFLTFYKVALHDGIAQRPDALTAAPKAPETRGLRGNKPR